MGETFSKRRPFSTLFSRLSEKFSRKLIQSLDLFPKFETDTFDFGTPNPSSYTAANAANFSKVSIEISQYSLSPPGLTAPQHHPRPRLHLNYGLATERRTQTPLSPFAVSDCTPEFSLVVAMLSGYLLYRSLHVF